MKRKTIYLGSEVLRAGEERAALDGRSFSNYIVRLIKKDLDSAKHLNGGNGPAAGPGEKERAA